MTFLDPLNVFYLYYFRVAARISIVIEKILEYIMLHGVTQTS